MKINIHGKNIKITEDLKDSIETECSKLLDLNFIHPENDTLNVTLEKCGESSFNIHMALFIQQLGKTIDAKNSGHHVHKVIEHARHSINVQILKIKKNFLSRHQSK